MSKKGRQEFFLAFDSIREFDLAFERKGPDTGAFFKTTRKIPVGDAALIRIRIKGIGSPFFLEGLVAWRRVRPGGPDMSAGVFVALSDRDRARLDGIVRYLSSDLRGQERRKSPRYPFIASAKYYTAQGEFESETRNLSSTGAFIRCMGPLLTVGARFPVTLFLEGENARGLDINATVAWIDMFDESKGMGVHFEKGQSVLRHVSKTIKRIKRDLKSLSE